MNGYRSGLEEKVSAQLQTASALYEYEPKEGKIAYTKPLSLHKYTPDFTFPDCHIIIETKGRFLLQDRSKHLLIKEQHPEYDIRFVFSNSKSKLGKGSKSTCGSWCDKHGFQYADKLIPDEWLIEVLQIQQEILERKYCGAN